MQITIQIIIKNDPIATANIKIDPTKYRINIKKTTRVGNRKATKYATKCSIPNGLVA